MRRIAGRFEREPGGVVAFVIRRQSRATTLDAWTNDAHDEVSVEVGMHADPHSAAAAQECAVALWATCVATASTTEAEPDPEVLDVLELGNAPTVDPMEVPNGVGQA